MNIIPSALRLTPATRSMINKAQYCQRRWQCNIIPSTHSHGACNLVLVLKISSQLWGRDWRNEHGAEFFGHICMLFMPYCLIHCGKCLKDKTGVEEGGQNKGKITWREFFAEYWQYVEVIVFPWLFIFYIYVNPCGPLYVLSLWCNSLPLLCMHCTTSVQLHRQERRESCVD